MQRLTKKELRTLLECIKECYPNCDLKTFSQLVVSRLSPLGSNNACSPTAQRQVALNRGNKDFADRDQLLVRLLSPRVIQAYRTPETVTDIQQKFTLVDQALNTLRLGLILLTPTGTVRLATACALQQVREYLGHRSLIGKRLPESLRMWVKEQGAIKKK